MHSNSATNELFDSRKSLLSLELSEFTYNRFGLDQYFSSQTCSELYNREPRRAVEKT